MGSSSPVQANQSTGDAEIDDLVHTIKDESEQKRVPAFSTSSLTPKDDAP